MRRLVISLVFAFAVLVPPLAVAGPAGAAGTVNLSVADFAFSPATLHVSAGTTVRVTNNGQSVHTWSSDPASAKQWDSGPLNPGASFSVTFDGAGSFGYHCNIHTFMTGTIVVDPATPPTTAPPAPTTTTAGTGTPQPTTATTAPVVAVGPTPTTRVAVRTTASPRTGAADTGPLLAVATATLLAGGALVASGTRRARWRVGRR